MVHATGALLTEAHEASKGRGPRFLKKARDVTELSWLTHFPIPYWQTGVVVSLYPKKTPRNFKVCGNLPSNSRCVLWI